MFLLNLTIIQSCNYDCYYCTMKEWTYPMDYVFPDGTKANALNNNVILEYLDTYLSPNEWIIKITGGEPGLYPEIDTLISELSKRGYKGVIETNGSLPIPKSDNFIRLAAWHLDKSFPKYYDAIVIIQNKNDNWKEKIEYCKKNNIKYLMNMQRGKTSPYTLKERIAEDATHEKTYYEGLLMIYSSGSLHGCPCAKIGHGSIFNMDRPLPFTLEASGCFTCPQFHSMDRLFK